MQWRWCASERKPAVTLRLPMATHCFERKPNTITARSKQHYFMETLHSSRAAGASFACQS